MFDTSIIDPNANKKRKRTMGRKCNVCERAVGNKGCLFATCNGCRIKNCKHEITHYDSALNKVCDDCGTVMKRTKQPFVRIPDSDMEAVKQMLADGCSVDQIVEKTKVLAKTVIRIQSGEYKSVKNILSELGGVKQVKKNSPNL